MVLDVAILGSRQAKGATRVDESDIDQHNGIN
jgi:hypothetical protein